MLSNPNINQLMEKAGSRYESAIAIAKRARQILRRRAATEDPCIKDAVDVASKEIVDGTAKVKIDGEYVVKEAAIDINTVINQTVEDILSDLDCKEEVKTKKTKKSAKKDDKKEENE